MKVCLLFDKKLFRFIAVGLVNTFVGYSIMFLLYNAANFSYWFSSACSYIIGGILSFFLNKCFTFKVRQWSVFMVVAFIVNIAFCYFFAYGAAKQLVNILLQNSQKIVRENIALFTGMCLFTGLNYLGQRLVVFRRREG